MQTSDNLYDKTYSPVARVRSVSKLDFINKKLKKKKEKRSAHLPFFFNHLFGFFNHLFALVFHQTKMPHLHIQL